jgi:hypothetical protein
VGNTAECAMCENVGIFQRELELEIETMWCSTTEQAITVEPTMFDPTAFLGKHGWFCCLHQLTV